MKKAVNRSFKRRTYKLVSAPLIFTLHMDHSVVSSHTDSDEKANPSKEGGLKPYRS